MRLNLSPPARRFPPPPAESAMSRAVWQVGQMVRETGIALERLGCRLQGNYTFLEQRTRPPSPSCSSPASDEPPPPRRLLRLGSVARGTQGTRRIRVGIFRAGVAVARALSRVSTLSPGTSRLARPGLGSVSPALGSPGCGMHGALEQWMWRSTGQECSCSALHGGTEGPCWALGSHSCLPGLPRVGGTAQSWGSPRGITPGSRRNGLLAGRC